MKINTILRIVAGFGLPTGTMLLKAAWEEELWLMLFIALLLLGVYGYVAYKDYQEFKQQGRLRNFLIKTVFSVGVCLAYLIFCYDLEPLILFFLAFFGPLVAEWIFIKLEEKAENTRCPQCNLIGGLKRYRSDIIGEEALYDGDNTGTRTYYRNYYRCRSCGYEETRNTYGDYWDYKETTPSYAPFESYDSNGKTADTGYSQQPTREVNLDTYTVNFRYRSGSAIKDECIYMKSNHQPSIAEIREEIRSRKYYPNEVDIYCLRFGSCMSSATASHPDNLL